MFWMFQYHWCVGYFKKSRMHISLRTSHWCRMPPNCRRNDQLGKIYPHVHGGNKSTSWWKFRLSKCNCYKATTKSCKKLVRTALHHIADKSKQNWKVEAQSWVRDLKEAYSKKGAREPVSSNAKVLHICNQIQVLITAEISLHPSNL